MRSYILGSILAIIAVSLVAGTACAQRILVGAKFPVLNLVPDVFVAYEVAKELVVESELPLRAFDQALAIDLIVKMFPLALVKVKGLPFPVVPSLGAGVTIMWIAGTFVTIPHLLAGGDYRLPYSHFSFFGELSIPLTTIMTSIDPGAGVKIGIQYRF